MSAASRILSLAECFCWRADMSVSISPFRCTNGLQATPLDAPAHETGDVQGGRHDANAVANDLGRDEERVHKPEPSWFGTSSVQAQTGRPFASQNIPTSWYVVKGCLGGAVSSPIRCFSLELMGHACGAATG